MEKATLIWNGHTLFGKEAVVKFLEELPSTQHNISSLDSQPLLGKNTFHFNFIQKQYRANQSLAGQSASSIVIGKKVLVILIVYRGFL